LGLGARCRVAGTARGACNRIRRTGGCGTGRTADPQRRLQVLVNADQLLQTVHVYQLIDVFGRIRCLRWILILHLGHQQRQKIVRRYGCRTR